MSVKEPSEESKDSRLIHDAVRRLIREALKANEQRRLTRIIDKMCKNVVLELFEEAHQ